MRTCIVAHGTEMGNVSCNPQTEKELKWSAGTYRIHRNLYIQLKTNMSERERENRVPLKWQAPQPPFLSIFQKLPLGSSAVIKNDTDILLTPLISQ